MIINGQQAGPFPKEELLRQGLTPQTPVWHQGMSDWRPAGNVSELSDLFVSPYGQHQGPRPGAYRQYAPGQTYTTGASGIPHTNWMPWAIVSCVLNICSCIGLVFSILGIVNASKANNFYDVGNDIQGDAANQTAKIMTILALVFAGLGIIGNIVWYIVYGAASLAALGNI